MRNNYYIDTENVAYGCVDFILEARENDRIMFFFSETSIQFGQLASYCQKSRATIEHITMKQSGSSAMDMLIVAMVVEDSNRHAGRNHIIVSNDNGYDTAIAVLNQRGYQIKRVPCKTTKKKDIRIDHKPKESCRHKKIAADFKTMREYQRNVQEWYVLSQMPARSKKLILQALDVTETRYDLYYKLLELYGKEQGATVYQSLKPYLHEIGR